MPETCVHHETGHLSRDSVYRCTLFPLLRSLSKWFTGSDRGLDSSSPQQLSGKGNVGLLQQSHCTNRLESTRGLTSNPSFKINMFLQMIYRTSITETVSPWEDHRNEFKCFYRIRDCPSISWCGNGHGNCSQPEWCWFHALPFQLLNTCANTTFCCLWQNPWHWLCSSLSCWSHGINFH